MYVSVHVCVNTGTRADLRCSLIRDCHGRTAHMKLRATFEFQEDYLLVKASGEITFDAALSLLKEAIDTANEKAIQRVLVDCGGVYGQLSAMERYNLGAETAKHALSRASNTKLAILGFAPTIDGLAVMVAANRGLSVSLFAERADALVWLKSFPNHP